MSPERARVFVAEGNPDWLNLIGDILRLEGHSVISTATTRTQALDAVRRFNAQTTRVNVAIINVNLDRGRLDGADGQAIIAAIRSQSPTVKIVGISNSPVQGADARMTRLNILDLGEVVRRLK